MLMAVEFFLSSCGALVVGSERFEKGNVNGRRPPWFGVRAHRFVDYGVHTGGCWIHFPRARWDSEPGGGGGLIAALCDLA